MSIVILRIQLASATVEFVFAPEERDVYSYECTRKDLAPLGAKPGSGTIGEQAKAIALLRSFGVKKGSPGYKHLAPSAPFGRSNYLKRGNIYHLPIKLRLLRFPKGRCHPCI